MCGKYAWFMDFSAASKRPSMSQKRADLGGSQARALRMQSLERRWQKHPQRLVLTHFQQSFMFEEREESLHGSHSKERIIRVQALRSEVVFSEE